jgi:hypothetical protein
MRITNLTIHIIEWLVISLMAFCGSFSFTSSNLYVLVQSPVASNLPGINPYLPEFVWGILFLFGLQSIILRNKGGGGFTWLVVIVSLPSILSCDTLNMFNTLGIDLKAMSKINFYGLLVLGVSIVIGYLLLNNMSIFKQTRLNLIKRRADSKDIDEVNDRGHLVLFLAVGATLTVATLLILISRLLEYLLISLWDRLSLNAALVGLGCILILAGFVYWLGSQRQSGPGR